MGESWALESDRLGLEIWTNGFTSLSLSFPVHILGIQQARHLLGGRFSEHVTVQCLAQTRCVSDMHSQDR